MGRSCTEHDERTPMPEFPAFEYKTDFTRTDPNKDQEWVKEIEIAAEESSSNVFVEMGSWAIGIAGAFAGSPVSAMIPLFAEKAMDYWAGEDEDQGASTIELDMGDIVKRVQAMTADLIDQESLITKMESLTSAIQTARSNAMDMQNDIDITFTRQTALDTADNLKTRFNDVFRTQLLTTRPEVAWFLFEPMFGVLSARVQWEMLVFMTEFQIHSGSHTRTEKPGTRPIDVGKRQTACGNLLDFAHGQHNEKNTNSLPYAWKLFLEFFETAFARRVELLDGRPECSNTEEIQKAGKKDLEGVSFIPVNSKGCYKQKGCYRSYYSDWSYYKKTLGATWKWSDNWKWGADPTTWEAKWTAYGDYNSCTPSGEGWREDHNVRVCAYTGHPARGSRCNIYYRGNNGNTASGSANFQDISDAVLDVWGGGNDVAKKGVYEKQILAKKEELLQSFTKAYNKMRAMINTGLRACREVDMRDELATLLKQPSLPKGLSPVVSEDFSVIDKNCAMAYSLGIGWQDRGIFGTPASNGEGNFFYMQQADFQKWGHDCGLEKDVRFGEYRSTDTRGKPCGEGMCPKQSSDKASAGQAYMETTLSECMRKCTKECHAWSWIPRRHTSRRSNYFQPKEEFGACQMISTVDMKGKKLVRTLRPGHGWVSGTKARLGPLGGCSGVHGNEFEVQVWRGMDDKDNHVYTKMEPVFQGTVKMRLNGYHFLGDESPSDYPGVEFPKKSYHSSDSFVKAQMVPATGYAFGWQQKRGKWIPTGKLVEVNKFTFQHGDMICPFHKTSKKERALQYKELTKKTFTRPQGYRRSSAYWPVDGPDMAHENRTPSRRCDELSGKANKSACLSTAGCRWAASARCDAFDTTPGCHWASLERCEWADPYDKDDTTSKTKNTNTLTATAQTGGPLLVAQPEFSEPLLVHPPQTATPQFSGPVEAHPPTLMEIDPPAGQAGRRLERLMNLFHY